MWKAMSAICGKKVECWYAVWMYEDEILNHFQYLDLVRMKFCDVVYFFVDSSFSYFPPLFYLFYPENIHDSL